MNRFYHLIVHMLMVRRLSKWMLLRYHANIKSECRKNYILAWFRVDILK